MAKNEDGEFELILGNRQLISVFLIVVILLGVFFSMGYIVGRNSAPAPTETAQNKAPATRLPNSDSPAASETAKPAEPAAPASDVAASPREEAATHPAKESAREESPAPPAQRAAQKTKPSATASAPPVESPAAPAAGEPAPGQYWQVVATARPDAEIITEALTKKGFHALMAPAPNRDGVFRVLVGPLKDAGSQAQTRTSLEAAGFKNPIVRKY